MNQINYGRSFSKALSNSLSNEISNGFDFEVGLELYFIDGSKSNITNNNNSTTITTELSQEFE